MTTISVLKLSGSPYDMGYQHGKAYHDAIHQYTEERIRLSSDPYWTGHALPREEVMRVAEQCVAEHQAYAPDLMTELQGMADATGLGLAELIIMNGFTDFIDVVYHHAANPINTLANDNCTAFIIPNSATADGHGFLAQTWDMHTSAMPFVALIHGEPEDGIPFYTFTTMGCIGMIGMNAAGICVGINNLMGGDGQVGVTWNFVVRKMLAQDNLDAAIECLTSAKLAGAHNYLVYDKHGRGYNIEAMSTHIEMTELDQEAIVHSNHCLVPPTQQRERERPAGSKASSVKRLARGQELLAQRPITEEVLMEITRDEEAICVNDLESHVATCGAAIMRPATGEFWALKGLPTENEYTRFTL